MTHTDVEATQARWSLRHAAWWRILSLEMIPSSFVDVRTCTFLSCTPTSHIPLNSITSAYSRFSSSRSDFSPDPTRIARARNKSYQKRKHHRLINFSTIYLLFQGRSNDGMLCNVCCCLSFSRISLRKSVSKKSDFVFDFNTRKLLSEHKLHHRVESPTNHGKVDLIAQDALN